MYCNKAKYTLELDGDKIYIQFSHYISTVDDRLISNFLQMKVNKYRTALVSYGGKIVEDVSINNRMPKNYSPWNRMNVSERWRLDNKAVHFEKKEDAQNALDWLESILLAKTLFKK